MEKSVYLCEEIKNEQGNTIAILSTNLIGDGSTPVIQTTGDTSSIIGYKDDGLPIVSQESDELIKNAQIKFMAKAIKEQKKLCVEKGVDPELVNMINAERRDVKNYGPTNK